MPRSITFQGDHTVMYGTGEETALCSCGGIVKIEESHDYILSSMILKLNHLVDPE